MWSWTAGDLFVTLARDSAELMGSLIFKLLFYHVGVRLLFRGTSKPLGPALRALGHRFPGLPVFPGRRAGGWSVSGISSMGWELGFDGYRVRFRKL